jgi:hypothetical protein
MYIDIEPLLATGMETPLSSIGVHIFREHLEFNPGNPSVFTLLCVFRLCKFSDRPGFVQQIISYLTQLRIQRQ